MKKNLLNIAAMLLMTGVAKAQTPIEPAGTGAKNVTSMSVVGSNLLYFGGEDGSGSFDYNLWKSDNGGVSQKIIKLNTITNNPLPSRVNEVYGKGYFFVTDLTNAYQPWVTDGTTAGTFSLGNVMGSTSNFASSAASISTRAINFVGFKGKVYFAVDNGNTNGNELWVTDGTVAGTQLFMDLYPGYKPSDPGNFIVDGNVMYFTAKASSNATQIWKTDGTVAGTAVIPFPSKVGLSSTIFLYKHEIYFGASTKNLKGSFYKTDGTTYTMVKDSIAPATFDTVNGKLILANFVNLNDSNIYVSDGTNAGTGEIKQGVVFSIPQHIGNKLFFNGTTKANGAEPWITDGTTSGTFMLNDVVAGSQGCGISTANSQISAQINGKIYFSILTSANYGQIWETDGTVSGTKMTYGVGATFYQVLNNNLYFISKETASTNYTKVFKLGSSATAINTINTIKQVFVYPNPSADGNFTVTFEKNSKLAVYDITGKEVYNKMAEAGSVIIGLSNQISGIYMLKITDENGNSNFQKIVKP